MSNVTKNKDESSYIVPNMPDPLWPSGVVPRHLDKVDLNEETSNPIVDAAWESVGVDLHWRCEECGTTVYSSRSVKKPSLCAACYEKEVTSSKLARRTNEGWQEQSAQLGLAIYERQPEETNDEWRIWEKYRSYYPLQLPTWTKLAAECNCSVAKVTRAAERWSYKARMIAWARFIDGDNQEKRIVAIRAMNEKQLTMAQTLQDKLRDAIDLLDPALLKPNEIVNMFKMSTELERRIVTADEEKVESTAVDTKTQQSKTKTKAENLAEVLSILQSTGVLQPDGQKVVGVEQTTRVLVKEDD